MMNALVRVRILEGSSGAPLRSTKRVGNSRVTADSGDSAPVDQQIEINVRLLWFIKIILQPN